MKKVQNNINPAVSKSPSLCATVSADQMDQFAQLYGMFNPLRQPSLSLTFSDKNLTENLKTSFLTQNKGTQHGR